MKLDARLSEESQDFALLKQFAGVKQVIRIQ
ncbi:MAG: hypothetical protein H6Q49_395 [Deltaproteobacteria bacterium]|nr:hypothetical protein [Deltaproteobacteria bacterium]